MSINHWNCPTGMCFYVNSTHSISDWNHFTPANTAIPSIWAATSFSCPSHLSYNSAILGIPAPTLPLLVLKIILRGFIWSPKSHNTGVIAESISSDHCSRRGASIILIFKILTSLLRYLMGRLCPWSIFLTKTIVDWSSALIVADYVKILDFTLSISSFACSGIIETCLTMYLAKRMTS